MKENPSLELLSDKTLYQRTMQERCWKKMEAANRYAVQKAMLMVKQNLFRINTVKSKSKTSLAVPLLLSRRSIKLLYAKTSTAVWHVQQTIEIEMFEWEEGTVLTFLKEYEKHPCLWNPYHKQYHNCLSKNVALKSLIRSLNIPQLTANDCLHQIKIIRQKYGEEQLRTIRSMQQRTPYNPPYTWYGLLARMLGKVIKDEEEYNTRKILKSPASETSLRSDEPAANAENGMKTKRRPQKSHPRLKSRRFPCVNGLGQHEHQREIKSVGDLVGTSKDLSTKGNWETEASTVTADSNAEKGNQVAVTSNSEKNTEALQSLGFLECPSCGWEEPEQDKLPSDAAKALNNPNGTTVLPCSPYPDLGKYIQCPYFSGRYGIQTIPERENSVGIRTKETDTHVASTQTRQVGKNIVDKAIQPVPELGTVESVSPTPALVARLENGTLETCSHFKILLLSTDRCVALCANQKDIRHVETERSVKDQGTMAQEMSTVEVQYSAKDSSCVKQSEMNGVRPTPTSEQGTTYKENLAAQTTAQEISTVKVQYSAKDSSCVKQSTMNGVRPSPTSDQGTSYKENLAAQTTAQEISTVEVQYSAKDSSCVKQSTMNSVRPSPTSEQGTSYKENLAAQTTAQEMFTVVVQYSAKDSPCVKQYEMNGVRPFPTSEQGTSYKENFAAQTTDVCCSAQAATNHLNEATTNTHEYSDVEVQSTISEPSKCVQELETDISNFILLTPSGRLTPLVRVTDKPKEKVVKCYFDNEPKAPTVGIDKMVEVCTNETCSLEMTADIKDHVITRVMLHCLDKVLHLEDKLKIHAVASFLKKKTNLMTSEEHGCIDCLPCVERPQVKSAVSKLTKTFLEVLKRALDLDSKHVVLDNDNCKCILNAHLNDEPEGVLTKIENCLLEIAKLTDTTQYQSIGDLCLRYQEQKSQDQTSTHANYREVQTLDTYPNKSMESEDNDVQTDLTPIVHNKDYRHCQCDTTFLESIVEEKVPTEDKQVCARSDSRDVGIDGALSRILSCDNGTQIIPVSLTDSSVTTVPNNSQKKISMGTQKREPILVHLIRNNNGHEVMKSDKQASAAGADIDTRNEIEYSVVEKSKRENHKDNICNKNCKAPFDWTNVQVVRSSNASKIPIKLHKHVRRKPGGQADIDSRTESLNTRLRKCSGICQG